MDLFASGDILATGVRAGPRPGFDSGALFAWGDTGDRETSSPSVDHPAPRHRIKSSAGSVATEEWGDPLPIDGLPRVRRSNLASK
jgi:hypothetical protein